MRSCLVTATVTDTTIGQPCYKPYGCESMCHTCTRGNGINAVSDIPAFSVPIDFAGHVGTVPESCIDVLADGISYLHIFVTL
jgi:hypothetical protein